MRVGPRWQEAVEWQACMTQGPMSSGTQMRIGSSFNKQAARPTGRCESGGGCGVCWRTRRRVPSSVVCNRPLPASSWISEKEGRWCEGKHDKSRLVGLAAGQERCTAWRRGMQARPVVPSPNQRANSARRNLRIVTRQQRRGHPGPVIEVKCEVTLGVIPVSLRRFTYDARSRCHSRS